MHTEIETIDNGKTSVITIQCDTLDAGNVKQFKSGLEPAFTEPRNLVLDMSHLKFVDSSGLGSLISTLRSVQKMGGELKLFGLTKPVQALFELVRMHRIFSIYETRTEALVALSPGELETRR